MLVYVGYFLAFLGLVFLALALYIWKQGDADFIFDTSRRSQLVLEQETADKMVFSFNVPFRNRGSQQGTLMDVFVRPWIPKEQFENAYNGVQDEWIASQTDMFATDGVLVG